MELSATHCRNAHAPCSLPAARSLGAFVFLAVAVLFAPLAGPRVVRAAEGGPGEHADIEIGGPGIGPGQFLELRDLAFGPEGRLHVLEGRRLDNQSKQWVGNCRVQVFDETAKFLEQFPIADARLNERHDPSRLAVDAAGRVFVAEAASGLVLEYRGRPSKLAHVYEVPGAFALCTWKTGGKERIVVVPRRREQNQWVPIDELPVIDPVRGKLVEPLRLARGVAGVMDAEADPRGNLFLLGEVNQLYKFDASGRLLAVLGSGTRRRLADGSELRHSVALDAQGRIYSQAWGRIARFEPDLKSVALRVGQFYWYDNWSPHDAPTPIAIDRHGRFWLGAPGHTPRGVRHHYRPCVMRAKADFFEKLRLESTLALGFDPKIETGLPYNVAYELAPIELTYVVPQAYRRIGEVVVDYRVLGVAKAEAAKGSFALKLEDGVEARQVFRFTPRRYGWYTVECAARTKGGEPVLAVGAQVGVTPRFDGMSVLAEGDSPGG